VAIEIDARTVEQCQRITIDGRDYAFDMARPVEHRAAETDKSVSRRHPAVGGRERGQRDESDYTETERVQLALARPF
jgi:hypothetical protein